MLTKFWEIAGGKLAERLLAASWSALVFWFGGVIAALYAAGGWSALDAVAGWLAQKPTAMQWALLIGAVIVVVGSGLLVSRLAEPALRLAQGYWPAWVLKVWWKIVAPLDRRKAAEDAKWQGLQARIELGDPSLSPEEFAVFLRLDRIQRRRPSVTYRRMPTRTGAILRAAESWPFDKYGLGAIAVWPRLWLVMPESTRAEILSARQGMTTVVTTAVWGLFFTGFGALNPWAVPVGLLVFGAALLGWLPRRAQGFADLLEAAFDLHRNLLYQHLRWPLPNTPAEERSAGEVLTKYLWRGSDASEPTFTGDRQPPTKARRFGRLKLRRRKAA